jgi:hypothetical protein
VLAAREDASAAFRLLLEDLGRDGVAGKDRGDQGITVSLTVVDQPSRDPAPVQASQLRPVGHR